MAAWWEDEYRRRMKAMGYEPTMDGMDDRDVKDALEAMDRRNAARQQGEWQYPRYKQPDPGFVARIMRMFGQPYDPKYISEEEKHYIGGWDNGDDDDTTPQVKPMPNPFTPQQPGGKQADKPWTLNWGGNGNMFGAKPQTPEYRPGGNGGAGVLSPSSTPSATPLGLHKLELEQAKPGDWVVGRDGVIRRAAEEKALQNRSGGTGQGWAVDGATNKGARETGTSKPELLVREMSYRPQTIKEGMEDVKQLPWGNKSSFTTAKTYADHALESAQKYAKIKGLGSVEDNEADGYRHFIWNARMARDIGWEPADIIASNHEEFDWKENYGAQFNDKGVATFEIPPASLMDLHNNHVGRQMAMDKQYRNTHHEELFQIALKNGNIITTLDHVPAFYGFDKNAVIMKRIGDRDVPFVKVTYDKGARTFTFHAKE